MHNAGYCLLPTFLAIWLSCCAADDFCTSLLRACLQLADAEFTKHRGHSGHTEHTFARYTLSSQTSATPVAVVSVLKGLKPNLSYKRKFRSLFVLVKSTRRSAHVRLRALFCARFCACSIMASSRAEPQPLPCHCGSTASLPI